MKGSSKGRSRGLGFQACRTLAEISRVGRTPIQIVLLPRHGGHDFDPSQATTVFRIAL